LTARSTDGEDILHQAFLLLFDRLAGGERHIRDPGKWLRGTVRNLVRTWWREKRKLPRDLAVRLHQLVEQADDASTVAEKAAAVAALERCLDKLSVAQRRLVSARYEEGCRITQIAERSKVNVATARVRLFRIRQGLKTCVETTLAKGGIA
jgi:RNA polymerase sigma-70 factor (ECF subfamily)